MPRAGDLPEIVVDKFGGSVLRRPEDIANAVAVVARQRASGLRPVVVVSAFEGVTDTILGATRVLLPDEGAALRNPTHDPGSALARETDRALATGEALSAALFALGLQGGGIPARSFSGAEAGIRTAAAHLGAEVRRVLSRPLRAALADGLVPGVAGFQGIGTHGELTTLGRGGTDLSAVVIAVALRATRCELFKDVGGVLEADPQLVPNARLLPSVDALQLELLAEMGAEIVAYHVPEPLPERDHLLGTACASMIYGGRSICHVQSGFVPTTRELHAIRSRGERAFSKPALGCEPS
jgi:aspartate kinase